MNRLALSILLCFVMAFSTKSAYSQTSTIPTLNLTPCKTWLADDDYQHVVGWMDSVSVAGKKVLLADTKAVQLYGKSLQALGAYDKAMALYRERLALDSTDTECAHALGVCFSTMGRYKEAIAVLNTAWERDKQNSKILRSLAETLFNDKQFQRARGCYALLIDKGTRNVQFYAQIARCYANEEDEVFRKNAISYYILIGYELAPTNRALVMESVEFLRGMKTPHNALYVLDKAVHTFPNDADIHAERGKNLLLQRRYAEARSDFAQALALGDSSRATLRELGVSYYSLQSLDTAKFYLQAALMSNLAKPDARTLAFLGVIYREQKQFDKAQIMFENALKLQKSDEIADLIVQQGLTYKLAGQKDSAFAKYTLAQQVDPNDTDVLYEMGTLLENNLLQRTAATQCFVTYLERTSARTSKAAQYALQRLESWGYNTQSLVPRTPTTATLNVLFSAPPLATTNTLHTTTALPATTDATLRLAPDTPSQRSTAGTIRNERR